MKRFLGLLPLVVLAFSCNRGGNVTDNFSSPITLFVDEVSSFTGGVISVTSAIKLRLTNNAGDSLAGTTIAKEVFKISPSVKGSTYWEDNRTIVFQPAQNLESDQEYEVTTNLKAVLPSVPPEKAEFRFIFRTLKQNYEVTMRGIKLYDRNNLTRLKIEGQLQTADVAGMEAIGKILVATQAGKYLTINWHDTGANNVYEFIIEEVARTEQAGEVRLAMDGEPIGVEKTEELQVPVPALSDYKVVSSSVVQGAEGYISVLFSDPLQERQNLDGLILFTNLTGKPRVVIDLNELKIYPTETITSEASLLISQAVKNSAGFKLKEDYRTVLRFAQMRPEVKLVNPTDKAILPNSKGLTLTFEAVALNAVDVVVTRIFEDNMLQYLQVNHLGGTSELRRVGRPVARKTIPLTTTGVTNLNALNQFSLNLEDIIKTEPGAMYQIRIGYRKGYSLYFCSDDSELESLDNTESWDAPDEDSYWDDAEYYYYPGFNWEERDNPCSNSYYGNRRSVTKMVLASNLGLIAKRRDNGDLYVFASNLVNTSLLSGVNLEVFDYQEQLLATATTNGEGMAQIKVDHTPFVLVAKKDDQIGYLKLDDGSALSLSNFDVTGTQIREGLKGFIYGERGVWRPADTIHLAFILERVGSNLPADHPVIMELYNPTNQLAFRKVSASGVGDIYRFDFITESKAPTGNWLAKARIGGATFTKTVRVETIKPNRLKIDLRFPQEKFTARNRNVTGDLNVRWLSGATASNLRTQYELMLMPVKTQFKSYPNFSFDDDSKRYTPEREMVFEGRVNSEGLARVNIDLGDPKGAPGAMNARLFGKVYEEGGDFSISSMTIPYYPFTSFVGVKAPDGDKRGMLLTDQDHEVRIASVDADGNPLSRNGIRVTLYKLNWKWWWDTSDDYMSNYVGSSYREPVTRGVVNTNGGIGTWTLRVNQPEWGRYYVRVEDPESGHSAGQVIYLDWPGWAGKSKRGELDGASMLDFAVDKEEYAVGDKINLSIPSTPGNRILVSLETGSQVLQTYWVDAREGNTSVSFDATPDMAPNVYAHLTLIQPHEHGNSDLPIRLYGVHSVKVVDPATRLQPVVQVPKELRPEQQYTIEVSEAQRQGMAYTVAIVDEGLLDITNFKTPDPWSIFYSREALGIKTWDVYDDVMGAQAGRMDRLLGIGGDAELKPKDESDANRFKPVVKFLGPFYLKPGATNKHIVKMPQYIGSVKTMVVAASEGAYGSAGVSTPVKQPLMVLATLPRVAGPGETIRLPVNLFAMQDNIGQVNVTVDVTGPLSVVGPKATTASFVKSGDRVIFFELKAEPRTGHCKVKVSAKAGSLSANYDIDIDVIPRNPVTIDVSDKIVKGGESWAAGYEPIGIAGENSGTIELSTLPPLNLEQRLQYLIQYPHGCIEQATSAVFAQLFLDKLMTLSDDRKGSIQKNVDAAIHRLASFQTSSGGFAYWPGETYPTNWGSNYAGHFLVEAKKAGYAVPDAMLAGWTSYQTQRAKEWGAMSSVDDNDLIQAYRLYTLAAAGAPAMGAMNRMKESDRVGREAKWRLASAYAVAGYGAQAQSVIDGLSTIPDTTATYAYRNTFGSGLRDRAMILETLLDLNKKEQAFGILLDLAKRMGDKDRWMSTQTSAYCLLAIGKYASIFPVGEAMNASVDVDGKVLPVAGSDFVHQLMVASPDKKAQVRISNNGTGPLFARLIRTGIPVEGSEEKVNRNIRFDIEYLDDRGNQVDVTNLPQGTNFRARVSVTNPGMRGAYTELALTQLFPSGWEIVNTRLDESQTQHTGYKYMDIRDDRVMHYFDLQPNKLVTFTVLLVAAYQGAYYLPSVTVEAMYDHSIFANRTGKWVSVTSSGN